MERISNSQQNKLVSRLVEFQTKFSPMGKSDAQWVVKEPEKAIELFITAVNHREGQITVSDLKPTEAKFYFFMVSDKVVIKALSNKELIIEAESTFRACIADTFGLNNLNKPGVATKKTAVDVLDAIISEGWRPCFDFFSALPGTWNQKCLSQNQVIEFCRKNTKYLGRNMLNTLFLVKQDEMFPVDEKRPWDNFYVVATRASKRLFPYWVPCFISRMFSRRLATGGLNLGIEVSPWELLKGGMSRARIVVPKIR